MHFTIKHFLIYLYIPLLKQIHIYVTSNTYENTKQSSVVTSGIITEIDNIKEYTYPEQHCRGGAVG